MSQTAIATKHTVTAVTGTAGISFTVTGRDEKQVLGWRQVLDAAVPLSDNILTHTAKYGPGTKDWISSLNLRVPTMETIGASSSTGYLAAPAVAAFTYYDLKIKRTMLMSQNDAYKGLDYLGYMILTDMKLRESLVGSIIADA